MKILHKNPISETLLSLHVNGILAVQMKLRIYAVEVITYIFMLKSSHFDCVIGALVDM